MRSIVIGFLHIIRFNARPLIKIFNLDFGQDKCFALAVALVSQVKLVCLSAQVVVSAITTSQVTELCNSFKNDINKLDVE